MRAGIDDDNMAFLEVLEEGMEVLKVDATARIIAALKEETDHLATRIGGEEEKGLTSSSSRSMAESALRREPRSDSMEDEIFPAPRRSAGLREGGIRRRSK